MSEHAPSHPNQYPAVWTVEAYMAAFRVGVPVEVPATAPLRGRILRGRTDEEFQELGSPEREIVFVLGPDGLSRLPGMDAFRALDHVGLTSGFVRGRIAQGYQFQLLIFQGGEDAPLATWDNALKMIAARRPQLREDILRHQHELPLLPVAAIERTLGASLDDIELAGPQHPLYMSLDRYLHTLTAEERADPMNLRRLLLHTDHLGTLFAGDGYTRLPDGQIGVAEYLVPNGAVASLPEVMLLRLL